MVFLWNFLAALTVFRSYECGLLPIETDDDGMVPEDLLLRIPRLLP